MFGMGMWELVVIVVVALLALGPEKLPEAAKTLSRGIRDFRKQTRELQETLEDDHELGDAIRDIKSALQGEDVEAQIRLREARRKAAREAAAAQKQASENASADSATPETTSDTASDTETASVASDTRTSDGKTASGPAPVDADLPTITPAMHAVAKGDLAALVDASTEASAGNAEVSAAGAVTEASELANPDRDEAHG